MSIIQFGGYSFDSVFVGGRKYNVECGEHTDELECRFADGGVYVKIKNPSNKVQRYISDNNLFLSTAFYNSQTLTDYDHGSNEARKIRRNIKYRNISTTKSHGEEYMYPESRISNAGAEIFYCLPTEIVNRKGFLYLRHCQLKHEHYGEDFTMPDVWIDRYYFILVDRGGRIIKEYHRQIHTLEFPI